VAQAATATAGALTVGGRAAAPAVATACVSGGPVTGAVCVVGAAALIAGSLYLTRDMWMPWLGLGKGAGGDGAGSQPNSQGVAGNVTLSWDPIPSSPAADGSWPIGIRFAKNAGSYYPNNPRVNVYISCLSPSGAVATTSALVGAGLPFTTDAASASGTTMACPAGTQLLQAVTAPFPAEAGAYANHLVWANPAHVTNAGDGATLAEVEQANQNAAGVEFRVERDCQDGGTLRTAVTTSSRAPLMPSCTERWPNSDPRCTRVYSGHSQNNIKNRPFEQFCNDVAAQFPDCAGGVCTLDVYYRGQKCLEGAAGCVSWSTGSIQVPQDYACRYGPYTLSMNACAPIERLYEPGGATLPATGPNTDGNPATWTRPQTQPSTGTRVRTETQPNPGTGTLPGTEPESRAGAAAGSGPERPRPRRRCPGDRSRGGGAGHRGAGVLAERLGVVQPG
jgi:hypothetical protein